MQEKICIFVHSKDDNPKLAHMKKSFEEHHGWGVCVLYGQSKIRCYWDALRITDRDRIVVCLDPSGNHCARDSTGFIETFLSYNTPILIGSVQDGCIVGYAGELFKMFDWIQNNHHQDQRVGIMSFMDTSDNIRLDAGNKIIHCHDRTNPYFIHSTNDCRWWWPTLIIIAISVSLIKLISLKNKGH